VLAWAAEFTSIAEAFAYEKQVQGWSRAKREALIRGDFHLLPNLASRPSAREDA
jgi:predicted GIY-YIG superfamily endonuclease